MVILCAAFLLGGIPFPVEANRADLSASTRIPDLIEALKDPDPYVRILAARLLGEKGESASAAVPALLKTLREKDTKVRISAAVALVKIDPAMKEAIPFLLEGVMNRKNNTAFPAGRKGSSTSGALSVREDIRQKWENLWKEVELTPDVVLLLSNSLKEQDQEVRLLAVLLLGGVSKRMPQAIPILIQCLEDRNVEVRLQAAGSLELLGSSATGAVPALSRLLETGSPKEKVRVAGALARIDPSSGPRVTSVLVEMARSSARGVSIRLDAIRLLGEQGPAARPEAMSVLVNLLADSNPDVRSGAGKVLGQMGSAAMPALLDCLKDRDRGIRYLAAEALGDIGPPAREAAPALIRLLKDRENAVRTSAETALLKIGSPAVPALQHALATEEDPEIRFKAGELLERIRSGKTG